MGNLASSHSASKLPPLQTVSNCCTERMMGTWFVIAVKPTVFETSNSNAVEKYTWNKESSGGGGGHDIDIDFTYNTKEDPFTSKVKQLPQKGWIDDATAEEDIRYNKDVTERSKMKTGNWKISPMWPIKLPYLLLEVDTKSYNYCVVGYPSRAYCWIMSRTPQMPPKTYDDLIQKLKEKHQYDLEGLRQVPQKWTKEDRTNRQLTSSEIPDSMLVEKTE